MQLGRCVCVLNTVSINTHRQWQHVPFSSSQQLPRSRLNRRYSVHSSAIHTLNRNNVLFYYLSSNTSPIIPLFTMHSICLQCCSSSKHSQCHYPFLLTTPYSVSICVSICMLMIVIVNGRNGMKVWWRRDRTTTTTCIHTLHPSTVLSVPHIISCLSLSFQNMAVVPPSYEQCSTCIYIHYIILYTASPDALPSYSEARSYGEGSHGLLGGFYPKHLSYYRV